MRGGVSLAVWIGGAVSELDLARRGVIAARLADTERASFWGAALPDEIDRASIYAEVLSKLGYTSISFDVLAGASAGGLNAAIYGLAQSVEKDIDWLRKVWEDQGDLAKLLHAPWDPRHPYRTEALLDADGVFYPTVLAECVAGRRWPHRPADGEPDGRPRGDLQSGPPLPDRDTGADLRPRTAHFRFRRIPSPTCGRSTTSRPAPVPTTTSPCGGWRTPHGRRARSRVPSSRPRCSPGRVEAASGRRTMTCPTPWRRCSPRSP